MKASLSITNTMTLSQVIARLSRREIVDGLIVIGSASKDELTPASDYDLVIVLSDMLLPLHVGLTAIDRRLTDLLFVATAEIEQILALDGPVDGEAWIGRIVRWLQAGTILLDRSGYLDRARQKVQVGQWVLPADEDRIRCIWSSINFNVRHNRIMLASTDPIYRQALDARMLYSVFEVFCAYFHVRGLLWEGEKAAVRYLTEHDPKYLELFNQCLAETEQAHKVESYEQLAALALAPFGGLCPQDATAIGLKPGVVWREETLEKACAFWDCLIADDV